MKKLSKWAKNNQNLARNFIIISHHIMLISAIVMGFLLYANDIYIPKIVLFGFVAILLLAYASYPIKGVKNGLYTHTYWRQKYRDLVFSLYPFMTAIFISHFLFTPIQTNMTPTQPKAQFIAYDMNPAPKETLKEKFALKKTIKKSKQQIKEIAKAMKRQWKSGNDGETGKKILLSLLVVVLTIVLGYLIGIFACTIACNGNEALGNILLIIGWGGLLTAATLIMIRIWKGKKVKT